MRRYIDILISFLILGGTLSARETPEYLQYVSEIEKAFIMEMHKNLGLHCIGSGGQMPHDVVTIDIMFHAHRRATIEEARKLEIYATQRLIDMVNQHEKIRPFLREYPFSKKGALVSIAFYDLHHGHHCSDGTVSHVVCARGKLFYNSDHPVEKYFDSNFEEPYEEALALATATPLIPSEIQHHQPFPYEEQMDRFFDNFAKEVKRKWGLRCDVHGGKLINNIEEVSIQFLTTKRTPLDKARKLYVEVTELLLKRLNADPSLRPYLTQYPFPVEKTKVCIQFRKKPYDYYTDGTVAIVHQDNQKILYFTDKPRVDGRKPISPVPLTEENYSDAKKLVLH